MPAYRGSRTHRGGEPCPQSVAPIPRAALPARRARSRTSSTSSNGAVPVRIAAGAWVRSQQIPRIATRSTSARPAAACGSRWTAASTGRTRAIASSNARPLAASPSPCPIRTSSMLEWARAASAATSRTVMASTGRPTPARPGRISGSRRRATSARSASTRRIRTPRTSRPSGTRTDRTPSAASSERATVARPGSACSTATRTPGRAIYRSIRTIRGSSMRLSGRRSGGRGSSSPAGPDRVSSAPPTAATPGPRSAGTRDCRRVCWERSACPRPRRNRAACTRSSKPRTAPCSARTTSARPGSARARTVT